MGSLPRAHPRAVRGHRSRGADAWREDRTPAGHILQAGRAEPMKAPFLLCYEGAPERKRIEFPWWTGWLCSVQICVCWPPRIASRMFCDLVSLRTHQTFVGVHRGGQNTGLGEGWVDFRGKMGSEEPGQPMQDFLMSTRVSSAWLSASFPCALRVRP